METTTERRQRANGALETTINVGITYKNALGADVALAFYTRERVAPAIVARVLGAARQRRRAPADSLVAERYGGAGTGDTGKVDDGGREGGASR
jgi:hypothetical protein